MMTAVPGKSHTADLPCDCRPCVDLAAGKVGHGYTWWHLREVLAADLQQGDVWVVPGAGAAWQTMGDGTVTPEGILACAGLGGVAWTLTQLNPDRTFIARRFDGAHEFAGRLPEPPPPRTPLISVHRTKLRVEPHIREPHRTWSDTYRQAPTRGNAASRAPRNGRP